MVRKPLEGIFLSGRDPTDVESARGAVREAYRTAHRKHHLLMRSSRSLSAEDSRGIVEIAVGEIAECDSSWEGGRVFGLGEQSAAQDTEEATGEGEETEAGSASIAWSGELVEVDHERELIYVSLDDPAKTPVGQVFFVRPFNYLGNLNALYAEGSPADAGSKSGDRVLAHRLALSRGESPSSGRRAPETADGPFMHAWGSSWGILWGPPGTGKTTMVGQNLAKILEDPSERVLVVSTTNYATDEVAVAIGRALRSARPSALESGRAVRIGRGAHYRRFEREGLLDMLKGTETELMRAADDLRQRIDCCKEHTERVQLQADLRRMVKQIKAAALEKVADPQVSVVVATAYKATDLLIDTAVSALRASGHAPFTTVVIDEAGCVSRATVAGLSLLASRRVLLAGDPKQLSPISVVARIALPSVARWLACSAVDHLDPRRVPDDCGFLNVQHRMHPDVSRLISAYQYGGRLEDSPEVADKTASWHFGPRPPSRALWYVLDEEVKDPAKCRAERSSGGRSWQRLAFRDVLEKLFRSSDIARADGLFLSPFVAQARAAREWFALQELTSWRASTVHSVQGVESDLVIFDTVHAGSTGWSYGEWQRLVNVALSRARMACMLLASRSEMGQPYLRFLKHYLEPVTLKGRGGSLDWERADPQECGSDEEEQANADPSMLGAQIRSRARLRPLMSAEQERLIQLRMDGKPRLVRGVAGSGKTLVLARWCVQILTDEGDRVTRELPALVVYGNRALRPFLERQLVDAWEIKHPRRPFPTELVRLEHIKDLLDDLARESGVWLSGGPFGYDADAACILDAAPSGSREPRCLALFLDEAQDMGHNTLRLLFSIVKQTDPGNPNSRAVHIMYDNAQDIYGRPLPKWSDLDLDMRGRVEILDESFRSTRPIIEFATNVLYGLAPEELDKDRDWKELVERGLIARGSRRGRPWWTVLYNKVGGPAPVLHPYQCVSDQYRDVASRTVELVRKQGVPPGQIRILSNVTSYTESAAGNELERGICAPLRQAGIPVQRKKADFFADAVTITTPHSFKGYDAEIVFVIDAQRFDAVSTGPLPKLLYVAMTRASSLCDNCLFAGSRCS